MDIAWTIRDDGGKKLIALSGVLDEAASLADLERALVDGSVIDLHDLRRINSIGVVEWLRFARAATAGGRRVTLVRCSLPFVAQLNMIAGFAAGCRIASALAPYACTSCGATTEREIAFDGPLTAESAARLAEKVDAPLACEKCGGPMRFDDVLDAYFGFLGAV